VAVNNLIGTERVLLRRILQNISVLCYYFIFFDDKITFLLIYLQNTNVADKKIVHPHFNIKCLYVTHSFLHYIIYIFNIWSKFQRKGVHNLSCKSLQNIRTISYFITHY